ncbi:response regulator transcription factor [Oxalobacteraceae bacterium A2-2]
MNLSTNLYRIALVDDHEPVRSAVSSLLRSYGYETDGYESAEALLDAGGQQQCACIITDLQMPGMSGLDLLEQLRRSGCQVPLIVLTAFPEASVRQRALQSGACCFLSKPFQANDLMRCVRQACGAP